MLSKSLNIINIKNVSSSTSNRKLRYPGILVKLFIAHSYNNRFKLI